MTRHDKKRISIEEVEHILIDLRSSVNELPAAELSLTKAQAALIGFRVALELVEERINGMSLNDT